MEECDLFSKRRLILSNTSWSPDVIDRVHCCLDKEPSPYIQAFSGVRGKNDQSDGTAFTLLAINAVTLSRLIPEYLTIFATIAGGIPGNSATFRVAYLLYTELLLLQYPHYYELLLLSSFPPYFLRRSNSSSANLSMTLTILSLVMAAMSLSVRTRIYVLVRSSQGVVGQARPNVV